MCHCRNFIVLNPINALTVLHSVTLSDVDLSRFTCLVGTCANNEMHVCISLLTSLAPPNPQLMWYKVVDRFDSIVGFVDVIMWERCARCTCHEETLVNLLFKESAYFTEGNWDQRPIRGIPLLGWAIPHEYTPCT